MNDTNTSVVECTKCSQKNRLTKRSSSGFYSCAKCGSRLKDPFSIDHSIMNQDNPRNIPIYYFDKGQYDRALPLFLVLLENGENDSGLYYMTGQCYRFLNKIDDAIEYLKQAALRLVEPDRNEGEHAYYVFLGLGIALQLAERYEESAQELTKAVNLIPSKWSACNSLGLTYKSAERYSDALKSYRMALERYVNKVIDKLETNTGEHLTKPMDVGGKKVAMMNTEISEKIPDALRSDPIYATLKDNIGRVYLALGDLDAAKESFEESIDYIPRGFDFPAPYFGLEEIAEIRSR